MTHKRVLFRSDAREKVLRGATAITEAIRVTLEPKSRSVLIEKRSAISEGIVPGAGLALLRAIPALEAELEQTQGDERSGLMMLRRALENAASVAGVLLLTEATMTELPEAKAEAPPAMEGM